MAGCTGPEPSSPDPGLRRKHGGAEWPQTRRTPTATGRASGIPGLWPEGLRTSMHGMERSFGALSTTSHRPRRAKRRRSARCGARALAALGSWTVAITGTRTPLRRSATLLRTQAGRRITAALPNDLRSGLGDAGLPHPLPEHLGVSTRRNGLGTHGHGPIALTLIEVIVPDYRQRRPFHDARPVEVPIEADALGEGMKFVLGIGCEAEPRWFVGPVAALTK